MIELSLKTLRSSGGSVIELSLKTLGGQGFCGRAIFKELEVVRVLW